MTGEGWAALGSLGSEVNQFHWPFGFAVDDAGRIYVADWANDRVVRIDDMTGAGWTTLGTKGSEAKQFDGPYGIFVDPGNRIYVTDTPTTGSCG